MTIKAIIFDLFGVLCIETDSNPALNMNVKKAVEYFKNKKYAIGIITNGNKNFTNIFLRTNNIENLFDHIVTSEEAGVSKPNKLIYQIMLNKLSAMPQELIFIDDSPSNTKAAKNIGIHVIDYTDQNAEQLIFKIENIITHL